MSVQKQRILVLGILLVSAMIVNVGARDTIVDDAKNMGLQGTSFDQSNYSAFVDIYERDVSGDFTNDTVRVDLTIVFNSSVADYRFIAFAVLYQKQGGNTTIFQTLDLWDKGIVDFDDGVPESSSVDFYIFASGSYFVNVTISDQYNVTNPVIMQYSDAFTIEGAVSSNGFFVIGDYEPVLDLENCTDTFVVTLDILIFNQTDGFWLNATYLLMDEFGTEVMFNASTILNSTGTSNLLLEFPEQRTIVLEDNGSYFIDVIVETETEIIFFDTFPIMGEDVCVFIAGEETFETTELVNVSTIESSIPEETFELNETTTLTLDVTEFMIILPISLVVMIHARIRKEDQK